MQRLTCWPVFIICCSFPFQSCFLSNEEKNSAANRVVRPALPFKKKKPTSFSFPFFISFFVFTITASSSASSPLAGFGVRFLFGFFFFSLLDHLLATFCFFCPRRWFVELVTGLGTVVSLRSTVTYPYMGRPYSPVVHWLSRQPPRAFGLPLVFFFFSFFGLGGSTRSIRRPFLASKSFRVVVWSFFFIFLEGASVIGARGANGRRGRSLIG